MSESNPHPAPESAKKHGDPLESAMQDVDQHADRGDAVDPVPPADNGGHPNSAAAHLDTGGKPHTKPAGDLRQGSHPGALREPPMVIQRVGKQHR